jgi:hypothetical protein
MNLAVRNLKPHLTKILDRTISETELSKFVQLCRVIVQSHLEHLRSSLVGLCLFQGLTMADLAYDCIADAFMRDENARFPRLENFASSLRDKLDTLPELEVFLAFRSFMVRIADAQLARLYAQADPAGARIHRNVRDCLTESNLFSVQKDFRGLVLYPQYVDSLDHLEPFPTEEMDREFRSRSAPTKSTIELLQILRTILVEQSRFRRSVTVTDVVQLVKEVYRPEFGFDIENADHPSLNGLTDFEIDEIRAQVELVLKEKILLTYFARGKANRKEAEAMFRAFHDLFLDWCHAGASEASLCEYLRRHLPINEQAYETGFRARMEYLLKIARDEFAGRLMREL